MNGTVGKNERSAEREERERSSERAESAAHAAKACTVYTLHFSEAKRGPGPGTSRLDFGGNPMTFFSLPHFHPDDQSWSLCVIITLLYIVGPVSSTAGLSLQSTLCLKKEDVSRLFLL